jgi:hypothetical protein
VLKRLRYDGWSFGCQVQKNRTFEGRPLRGYRRQPNWQAVGKLSGGIKVRVVTNRLSLTAPVVREIYKRRHVVEQLFRFLKD